MNVDGNSRALYRRIAERSVAHRRGVRFGEDPWTISVGGLSASLGLVLLAAIANSLLGQPMGDWGLVESAQTMRTSTLATAAGVTGMILGGLGLTIGWQEGRRVSIVSALGVLACHLALLISWGVALYHDGSRWLG